MIHYAHCFTINRLRLAVHLGFEAPERATPQPVDIDIRLYFQSPPACAGDDYGAFIDYAALCNRARRVCGSGEFRLLEYLAGQVFAELRAYLDAKQAGEVKLWVKLTKCNAPVANLEGGASFVLTDLPPAASVVDAH